MIPRFVKNKNKTLNIVYVNVKRSNSHYWWNNLVTDFVWVIKIWSILNYNASMFWVKGHMTEKTDLRKWQSYWITKCVLAWEDSNPLPIKQYESNSIKEKHFNSFTVNDKITISIRSTESNRNQPLPSHQNWLIHFHHNTMKPANITLSELYLNYVLHAPLVK